MMTRPDRRWNRRDLLRWLPASLPAFGLWSATSCVIAPPPPTLPMQQRLTREQLHIHSNFELPQQHRLFNELVARRTDVHELLGLPVSDEPIFVYLFDSSESYTTYLRRRFPDFPDRRAFFVETDTRLEIFAYWGDRVAEDLRHEVAHGYLHAVVPGLPLWLDEGLAEYFEVPRTADGRHERHIRRLARAAAKGTWRPNLPRLEGMTHPDQMAQQDYAESWAWVHWLLESTPKHRKLLRRYLARLRVTGAAPLLSRRLTEEVPEAERQLLKWLTTLADEQVPALDE